MSDLEALLAECERIGDCAECRCPPAPKAAWERHDREYGGSKGECPTQSGTGECWCVDWCWCDSPETRGASDRERRLVAIVRALSAGLLALAHREPGDAAVHDMAFDAIAEAERIATEGD